MKFSPFWFGMYVFAAAVELSNVFIRPFNWWFHDWAFPNWLFFLAGCLFVYWAVREWKKPRSSVRS